MLAVKPKDRVTLQQMQEHEFFKKFGLDFSGRKDLDVKQSVVESYSPYRDQCKGRADTSLFLEEQNKLIEEEKRFIEESKRRHTQQSSQPWGSNGSILVLEGNTMKKVNPKTISASRTLSTDAGQQNPPSPEASSREGIQLPSELENEATIIHYLNKGIQMSGITSAGEEIDRLCAEQRKHRSNMKNKEFLLEAVK
jgi:hypothetical protein